MICYSMSLRVHYLGLLIDCYYFRLHRYRNRGRSCTGLIMQGTRDPFRVQDRTERNFLGIVSSRKASSRVPAATAAKTSSSSPTRRKATRFNVVAKQAIAGCVGVASRKLGLGWIVHPEACFEILLKRIAFLFLDLILAVCR